MRAIAALILMSACASDPAPRIVSHDTVPMSLERLTDSGPFVAGSRERFRLVLDDEEGPVSFAASAGRLSWDGREVEWTLPYAERAWLRAEVDTGDGPISSTFTFGIWAVPAGARGPVDTGDDETGDVCDLEIDSGDTPHVIYRNDTHPSLWYATYNGSSWQTELVDGMGWDTGGEVTTNMALTLDSSGTPHIVYLIDIGGTKEIRYARPSGATWLLESVTTSTGGHLYHNLDIEMATGGEPVVLYTIWLSGSGNAPEIATRTGADSWTTSRGSYYYYAAGGLERDASGTMHVTLIDWGDVNVTTWDSGVWGTIEYVASGVDDWQRAPLALDGSGNDIVMYDLGIDHDLGGRNWSHSEIEAWTMDHFDLAFATIPHVALVHSDHLELVTPDSRGYWSYANVGSAHGPVAVAVDTDGNTHACYQYDNRVMFY